MTSRRRRSAAWVAVALMGALALPGCTGSQAGSQQSVTRSTMLAAQTAKAGPVEVKVTPKRIDASGATFEVDLNNHEAELTGDYAAGSSLDVAGRTWGSARWVGDPPGGHHRAGTLSFDASGPAASGAAVLRLAGLPAPIELSWPIPPVR